MQNKNGCFLISKNFILQWVIRTNQVMLLKMSIMFENAPQIG